MHLPHDGRALSQRFFFLLQFRHTLDDLAIASGGDGASDDVADMVVLVMLALGVV